MKKLTKTTDTDAGVCPNCGCNDLSYGNLEIGMDGETLEYSFVCEDCNCRGYEHYEMKYLNMEYETNNDEVDYDRQK